MKTLKLFIFGLLISQLSPAQNTKVMKSAIKNPNLNTAAFSSKKMTGFNPLVHGFKFINSFAGIDASQNYGGLCGGMVYSALDYYNSHIQIPQQAYAPANRYPLQSYIYKRQAKAAQEGNWDKWGEMMFNPEGARNSEFFGWGLEMKKPGDRMNELKANIDAGRPVPLGLKQNNDADKYGYKKRGDHFVLAVGYDFGRYKGDKGDFIEDFKIFIYDPNHPGFLMTMVADPAHNIYHYTEPDDSGKTDAWLAYFVDSKYDAKTPPVIPTLNPRSTIYAFIGTGQDDLRGGNDNLNITVVYRDGSRQSFPYINLGATWVPDYEEVVPLQLNRELPDKFLIKEIILETTFGGGIGGDNWDMTNFKITTSDLNNILIDRTGTFERKGFLLVKRFTGDDRSLTIPMQ